MAAFAIPVVPSRIEAWKQWTRELQTTRKAEFEEFNRRMGLSKHKSWLMQTPQGPLAVVLHEGSGEATFLSKLATSDNPFDVWFRNSISDFHGVDLTKPMPAMPEPFLTWEKD